jgi:AcrR family transcriptional regulator
VTRLPRSLIKKPPAPAARRSDSQQIVSAVITAAMELGPDTTLTLIAERAGVGIASLHRYFPTSAALFAEVSREMYRTLIRQVREITSRTDLDVTQAIVEVCRVVITEPRLSIEHRRRLSFDVPLEWSREVAEAAYREVLDEVITWLARRLPERPRDLEDRVFVAFAAVRGAVMVALLFPDLAPSEDRLVAQVARFVTQAIDPADAGRRDTEPARSRRPRPRTKPERS